MRVTQKRGRWAALAIVLGLIGVAAVLPTSPVSTPAFAEDTAQESPAQFELVVAPQDAVIEPTSTETSFRVLLRNTGKKSLPEGSVELTVGNALSGGSALNAPATPDSPEESTEGTEGNQVDTGADSSPTVIATEAVAATSGESVQEIIITAQTADLPFSLDAARSVYPLHATFAASDSAEEPSLSAYSPLVWAGMNPGTEVVALTLVIPFILPTSISTMPSRSQLGNLAPKFSELLDYAESVQAVLAIDPRIVAAIRAYGSESPQSARDLLERFERTNLTSFLLQYSDADPAVQSALGFPELLQPTGLEFVTRFGVWPEVVPEPGATSDANSSADAKAGAETNTEDTPKQNPDPGAQNALDPDAPHELIDPDVVTGAPSLSALGAWAHGLNAAWPAGGQVGPDTINLLHASGLNTTVLRSDNVVLSGGPRAALNVHGSVGETIVTDAELDAGVRLAYSDDTNTERDLGSALAAARLALAVGEGTHGLVLGVDRSSLANSDNPRAFLESLTALEWINTVNIDVQESGSVALLTMVPGAERTELLGDALANEDFVREVRSLLVHPEYLDGYQRMRLLSLFATRYAEPDEDFKAAAKRFTKRDNELHDGVRIVGTKHAQLVGTSTRIPIQVRNTLPFDAIVNVSVAPTSAVLSVPERTFSSVLLPQDSTERVLVPVNSRVSSGESALLISVADTNDEYIASTDVLPISVSTNVETIALLVLGSAAVLLFGFGIWRSLRRRRTSSTLTSPIPVPSQDDLPS